MTGNNPFVNAAKQFSIPLFRWKYAALPYFQNGKDGAIFGSERYCRINLQLTLFASALIPVFGTWHRLCFFQGMWRKFKRLFIIKTKFEAFLITYALATGAVARGQEYLIEYPGIGGKLLFAACTGAVFMAGAKMLEAIEYHNSFGEDY